MPISVRIFGMLLLTSTISEHASAHSSTPTYDLVKSEITVGGHVIAAPVITMAVGSTASAKSLAAADGYSLTIDLQKSEALGERGRKIRFELYLPQGQKWLPAARPTLETTLGQSNAVSLRTNNGQLVEIKFTIQETPNRPAVPAS